MRSLQIPAAFLAATLLCGCAAAQTPPDPDELMQEIDRRLDGWVAFYEELHRHPELSLCEEWTAARIARAWRAAGADVSTGVGGHGVVGLVRNGAGPTLLLRTDLDALPIREATELPYASTVCAELEGQEVGVMHACGHDMHMSVLCGAVEVLAALRERWRGTLLLVGQPAEERGVGSRAMLADGLFERFPRPDHGLAIHVDANLPAGHIGWTEGWVMANVDSVDIAVRGKGGHGAQPHETRDPVVLAARIVLALQTIVSRELAPTEPAVVTVGSIHGGSKHNLIPDRVELQLTVRSYSSETRERLIEAIRRTCRGTAEAAGFPAEMHPQVRVRDEFTPSLYNDPALVARVLGAWRRKLPEAELHQRKPEMVGEDFARYGMTEPRVPIFLFRLGTVGAARWIQASAPGGAPLPGLHNARFAPEPRPTLRGGVRALSLAALELLAL